MTPLAQNIASMRAEAAAQRVKAAEIRQRALWWFPCFRAILRADARALDMGADELERQADAWDKVETLTHKDA